MLHTKREMYDGIWQKYLPIMRIVMKKARSGEQSVKLNAPDFERIGLTRKSGYKFELHLHRGKVTDVIVDHPLAASLAQVLLADPIVDQLTAEYPYTVSLSGRYEMTFKCAETPGQEVSQPPGQEADHQ